MCEAESKREIERESKGEREREKSLCGGVKGSGAV